MRILVTRPKADAEDLQRELEAAGHEVIISSMLEIALEPLPEIGGADLAAIIITSQNALRALAVGPELAWLTGVQVFAVGPKTAKGARELGFERIVEGPGTGAELAPIIAASGLPKDKRIVHLAGDKLAFDMAAELGASGYRAETITAYRQVPAQSFTPDAESKIRRREIDLVTLMSPQTARTFVSLIKSAGLQEQASSLSYACISEAALRPLEDEGWPRAQAAAGPNREEVVALVNRMAAQSQ